MLLVTAVLNPAQGNIQNVVNSNWAQTSTANNPPLCGTTCTAGVNGPQQGSYYAFFGANPNAETSSIQQNNIRFSPSNNYVVRFQSKIASVTAPFNASLTVKIDGNVIHTITEPSVAQTAYSQVFVTIPRAYHGGGLHTIRFEYINPAGSGASNFLVDQIFLERNAIDDGGFEQSTGTLATNIYWNAAASQFTTPLCTEANCGTDGSASPPRTGTYWAWFGGTSNAYTGSIQQSFVVPFGARPVLKFWLRNGSVSAPFSSTLKVLADGVVLKTIAEKTVRDAEYSQISVALPPGIANNAAHIIRLEFAKVATATISSMVVDDITLDTSAAPTDFDGDRKTDVSIFRPSVGEWYFQRSSTGVTNGAQFGASTDIPVPADYTGDGKTDFAFYRPSTGTWFILRSEDFSFFAFPFGISTDIAAPGDFDGDGKADAAVFRASVGTWFIQNSSGGVTIQPFGTAGDRPVVADYDGDGRSDIAIFRPSVGEWYTLRSSDGIVRGAQFGASTDRTVQGDYTGDGKADFAFYRPSSGQWFVLRSEDSSFFASPFGVSTDTPTIGDYDGDGKFDQAVFRPSTGQWILNRSTAGVQFATFGTNTDLAVPAYYLP